MLENTLTVFLILAVVAAVFLLFLLLFLLFREAICWYWKINESLGKLGKIEALLKSMDERDARAEKMMAQHAPPTP